MCAIAVALLAGAIRPSAAAGPTSTKARVAALMEAGWTRTSTARKQAELLYAPLAEEASRDWRVPYAYALVQIQQYRYIDAAKLLDQVLALDPANMQARRLRIWIAVILKDYPRAIGMMEGMPERLPPEPADPAADAIHLDTALMLGRICGFLEGPARSSVNRTAVAACSEVLESRLTGGRRTAFQNGRRAVLRQSSALDEETQITKEEVKEAGEKVKEKVVGELTRQSAELATQLDAEQARLAELAKQLNYDLEQIGTEEKQCSQRLQTAQAAAQDAGFRLRDLDGRVAELYDMANREKDPNLRQQILFDAAHWRSLRDRTAAELAARNQQVAIEMAKLRDLQLRRTKINARWQKESGGVAKLEGSLKRTLRDKDRTEKKAVDTLTPQTATQQQRSVALSTYVPLPVVLEKERERVLLLFDSR